VKKDILQNGTTVNLIGGYNMTFGELKKDTVFFRNKKWFKKYSPKDSAKKLHYSGFGYALDENKRINFFGNYQKVERYEFRQICK